MDFSNGVTPPGGESFVPPKLDFGAIADLPKQYFAGQEAQAELAQRKVFRNGIPKDPSGYPNYGEMADMMARSGAKPGEVIPLATAGIGLEIARGNADAISGGGPSTAPKGTGTGYEGTLYRRESGGNPAATNPNSSAGGLAQFTKGTWNDLAQRHPELQLTPDTGMFDEKQVSRALPVFTNENTQQLSASGVPVNDRTKYLAHFLGAHGATAFYANMRRNPNAPAYQLVSPEAARDNQSIFFNADGTPRTAIQAYAKITGGFSGGDTQTAAAPGQPMPTQVAGPPMVRTQPQPAGASGDAGAPAGPASPQPQQPQSRFPSASALVPPAWVGREQQYASALAARAASVARFDPKGAEQLGNLAKQIQEAIQKDAAETPGIKEYRTFSQPGETQPQYSARTKGLEKQAEGDVAAFEKQYTGIQSLGQNAYNGMQKAKLAKNLTLDPNFYSGPLNEQVETYNQFKAIFGSNPASALPQEAFNKAVNDMLQEQIKSMGQSGVGRVLQAEVNIMRQAIASLGITPASNRALLEIVQRVYKQHQDMWSIAQTIPRSDPGSMRAQLDQKTQQYLEQHPLFTKDEMQHPQMLAAPDAPPSSAKWSPAQARAWAQSVGLKSGDPIRVNGQIMAVP